MFVGQFLCIIVYLEHFLKGSTVAIAQKTTLFGTSCRMHVEHIFMIYSQDCSHTITFYTSTQRA